MCEDPRVEESTLTVADTPAMHGGFPVRALRAGPVARPHH